MDLTFRLATPEDYPILSEIQALAFRDAADVPISPITVEDFIEGDEQREPHCRFARWVAEKEGVIAGWAEYDQNASRYHPGKFWIDGYVHPDHQYQGIGSVLYDHLLAAMMPYDPIALRCDIREDVPHGIAFLERRGWQEAQRTWAATLDVAAFDPAPYLSRQEALQTEGIQVQSLTQLETDPGRDRKLYELVWEIRQDLPDLDAATREPFDIFISQRLHHPDLIPDAYFVATQGETYLGYIYHFGDRSDPATMRIAQLGVARTYRGRGIAQVLKMHGLLFARSNGYKSVSTTNRSDNQAVLAINSQMNFVRQHAWLHMLKRF
jgi:mycothiol synthase